MANSYRRVLRNQGRGITGALLVVGLTFLYTMETWWLAETLPLTHLFAYTVFGLAVVLLGARSVGFREEDRGGSGTQMIDILAEYTEILFQSFVAAFFGLFMLGIIEWGDSLVTIVRLGLLEVVPLGFGAALANRLFAETDEGGSDEVGFPRNIAVFALGSIFIAATVAPTEEMELIAAHMTWPRHALMILVSLGVVYVALYELEFRDQAGRAYEARIHGAGMTFVVYAVSVAVSALLLWAFGHFTDATLSLIVQETIVLSFPAAVAAAGAQVVI